MKWCFPRQFVFVMMFIAFSPSTASQAATSQPNILLMIADDLGWNDVGFHGSEIRTPNIDRIAKEGVELDRFYVHPSCSPTRAALMTGKSSISMGPVTRGPLMANHIVFSGLRTASMGPVVAESFVADQQKYRVNAAKFHVALNEIALADIRGDLNTMDQFLEELE